MEICDGGDGERTTECRNATQYLYSVKVLPVEVLGTQALIIRISGLLLSEHSSPPRFFRSKISLIIFLTLCSANSGKKSERCTSQPAFLASRPD